MNLPSINAADLGDLAILLLYWSVLALFLGIPFGFVFWLGRLDVRDRRRRDARRDDDDP